VAGFAKGDAISNEAALFRKIFRSWGHTSDIFCESRRIMPELRTDIGDVTEYVKKARHDDVVLLHLSIGSIVNDIFTRVPGRKAILYHNITPQSFFVPFQKQIARNLEKGREQMSKLAGAAGVIMADSRFNASELAEAGYRDVKQLPILLDSTNLCLPPDRKLLSQYGDGKINVVFVGRCVPNKKIEDVLQCFAYFQKTVEPRSRLILVGSYTGMERYFQLLTVMARDLRLDDTHFLGTLTQSRLNAIYRRASVFLCMSEHEGFCIPILESMINDVPVLAYSAAAVPETMAGAGVLFTEKRFEMVAEMIGQLTRNTKLRDNIIKGQRDRVASYHKRDLESELRQNLASLLPAH